MPEQTVKEQLATGKVLLSVLQWAGPVVLGLVAGYGSVTFTNGAREQRLVTVEGKVIELQKQMDRNWERFVSREELKGYLDGQTRALEQIQSDVRALRNQR